MKRVFMPQTEKSMMSKKLVGVHIDKNDANRIALLSLEKGIPRTAILLELLNDYLAKQESLSVMIENAVNKAVKAWNEWKEKSPPALNGFLQEIRQDLISHRIDKEIIEQIIKGVKESI